VAERVYLVPGFFGFTNLGELKYFGHVRDFLLSASAAEGRGLEVHTVRTPPTSSLRVRAAHLLEAIAASGGRRDGAIHLIGHSSGGLDIRLLLTPGVSLPTAADPRPILPRVRTAVTVAAPHHGTPVAAFFTGLLGEQLLQLLSLSTIYLLRFGTLPVGVLLRLGATFARLDRHLGVNSRLLDQLFGQLLGDFTLGRRRAIGRLLEDVRHDRALLTQLTPAGMDLFDATAASRPGVRCGSVLTQARPPGIGSLMAAGIDPSAHASHAVYRVLYGIAAARDTRNPPTLTRTQALAIRRLHGALPTIAANDGVVPTLSQVWGEVIDVARADHLDVIGHFHGPQHDPPHFDWLATGTGFDRSGFERVWTRVLRFLRRGRRRGGRAPPRPATPTAACRQVACSEPSRLGYRGRGTRA
jgi:triacylglycerol esterase/lipase EstA (alpha/beta hydrolase family)